MRHRSSFLPSRSMSSCVPCTPLTLPLRKRHGPHHRNTPGTSGPSFLPLCSRKISRLRNAGLRTTIVCFLRAYMHILTCLLYPCIRRETLTDMQTYIAFRPLKPCEARNSKVWQYTLSGIHPSYKVCFNSISRSLLCPRTEHSGLSLTFRG